MMSQIVPRLTSSESTAGPSGGPGLGGVTSEPGSMRGYVALLADFLFSLSPTLLNG